MAAVNNRRAAYEFDESFVSAISFMKLLQNTDLSNDKLRSNVKSIGEPVGVYPANAPPTLPPIPRPTLPPTLNTLNDIIYYYFTYEDASLGKKFKALFDTRKYKKNYTWKLIIEYRLNGGSKIDVVDITPCDRNGSFHMCVKEDNQHVIDYMRTIKPLPILFKKGKQGAAAAANGPGAAVPGEVPGAALKVVLPKPLSEAQRYGKISAQQMNAIPLIPNPDPEFKQLSLAKNNVEPGVEVLAGSRSYIKYLVCDQGKTPNTMIPTHIYTYDTETCYTTFFGENGKNNKKIENILANPKAFEHNTKFFLERLKLYHDFLALRVEPPTQDQINHLFANYLADVITDKEKIILRAHLFIGDTNAMMQFDTTPNSSIPGLLHDVLHDVLQYVDNGSYLIRKSRAADTNVCITRTFSFSYMNNNSEKKIFDIRILHVHGYGYYFVAGNNIITLPSTLPSETELPKPKPTDRVFACFIDILDFIFAKYNIDKLKNITDAREEVEFIRSARNLPTIISKSDSDIDKKEIDKHINDFIKYCLGTSKRPCTKIDLDYCRKFYFLNKMNKTGTKYLIDKVRESIDKLLKVRLLINKLGDIYTKKMETCYIIPSLALSDNTSAERILAGKDILAKSFILRFSQSTPNCMAVTYTSDDKSVHHVQITSVEDGWWIKEDGKVKPEIYLTIDDLILKCKIFESCLIINEEKKLCSIIDKHSAFVNPYSNPGAAVAADPGAAVAADPGAAVAADPGAAVAADRVDGGAHKKKRTRRSGMRRRTPLHTRRTVTKYRTKRYGRK